MPPLPRISSRFWSKRSGIPSLSSFSVNLLYLDFYYFTFLIIKFKLRIGKLLSFPYVLSLILHLNSFSYVSSCFHPLTFLPRFYMERAGQFWRRPSACLTKKAKDMTPCCRSSTRTGAGCVAPRRWRTSSHSTPGTTARDSAEPSSTAPLNSSGCLFYNIVRVVEVCW
jgi:hypothetical protein